jgi:hypothetical protein
MSNTKIFGANHGIATANVIPDNNTTALDIESTDAKDYITIDTTDGSEKITLSQATSVKVAATNVSADTSCDDLVIEGTGATGASVVTPNNVSGCVAFRSENTGGSDKSSLMVQGLYNSSNKALGKFRLMSGSTADDYLEFETNGSQRLKIDGTGATTVKGALGVQDADATIITNSADEVSKSLIFKKSRNATDGSAATIVQDDDVLGEIEFKGANGAGAADANFSSGAKIFARVNGTPGDDDMPTELVFCTSADGSEAPAERMHIFENGSVGINETGQTSKKLAVTGDVRFSANVLASKLSWVNDSSFRVAPGSTDSDSKLNGPLAFKVTSEPTGITDCAEIYAKDVSTSAEMFVRDEAGNETQLSPHNFEMFEPDPSHTQPWSYTSKNAYIGKEVGVDMFGLVKAVEELSGKTLMYERDLPDEEVKDWYVEQGRIQAAREAKIAEWDASKEAEDGGLSSDQPRPEPYTVKDPPDWLKSRLKLGGD